jgi:hypothetical protein
VTDNQNTTSIDSASVSVNNVPPIVDAGPDIAFDDGDLSISGFFTDPGDDIWTATVNFGDDSGDQELIPNADKTFSLSHTYVDNGVFPVTACVDDDDGGSGCDTVEVTNFWTTSLAVPDATVEYSDKVVLEATLVNSFDEPVDGVELTFDVLGVCNGTAMTDANGEASFTCGPVQVADGNYPIRVDFAEDDSRALRASIGDGSLVVSPEDAAIAYSDASPLAVRVLTPGGNSGPFSVDVDVTEKSPDLPLEGSLAAPGDIDLAEVDIMLQPIGPGSPGIPLSCQRWVVGTGYDRTLTVSCEFNEVPVNTYSVLVMVNGMGYYSGKIEEVVTVFDPSLGFTTGGGYFLWPGTNDKTNFGFTVKYNKKLTNVKGSLLLIRHLPDGTLFRVKSNALYGLAVGEEEDVETRETFGWASFSGKATYREPGWPEPVGNHEFIAYVEDRNEPGSGLDRFWIQVKDKDGIPIPVMSIPTPATGNAVELGGGNIVVPHSQGN